MDGYRFAPPIPRPAADNTAHWRIVTRRQRDSQTPIATARRTDHPKHGPPPWRPKPIAIDIEQMCRAVTADYAALARRALTRKSIAILQIKNKIRTKRIG
jgi:hypothetical protein